MSIVAEFDVPTAAFCLETTLAACPDATVELDGLVAHSPDHVMPFVWVLDADRGVFEAAAADDPTVEAAEVTDSFDDTYLYQFTWADVVSTRLHVILDHDGVVLEARGRDDTWHLAVRFGSREHFSEFRDHFSQYGEVTLQKLTPTNALGDGQYGVSSKQREALLAAYDAGYYGVPSETPGEDVARELDISQQAFSRRLKRGTTALLENTLVRQRDD
jgi:hypothetical protein